MAVRQERGNLTPNPFPLREGGQSRLMWQRLRSAECRQAGEEVWEGFCYASRVFDFCAGEFQTEDREAHCDSVIVVGFDWGGAHRRWADFEAVFGFAYVGADATEFGG